MDGIDKDCIACYGTGFHIHVYSSDQPMWGGCVKCNPETHESLSKEVSQKEPFSVMANRVLNILEDEEDENSLFISHDSLEFKEFQEYYWIEIVNGGMKKEPPYTDDINKDTNLIQLAKSFTVEIVAGIWSSSEDAEIALKKFKEKPDWEYKNKIIIVLNHDCLNTLLKCNEFSYRD